MSLGTLLGTSVLLTLVFIVLIYLAAYGLAAIRVGLTFCAGGEIVPIVTGKSPTRFIMSHEGFHLNDPNDSVNFDSRYDDWEVLPNQWGPPSKKTPKNYGGKTPWNEKKTWKDSRGWINKFFGIYWVGIPPKTRVYGYKFQWAEIQQKETPEGQEGTPGLTVKVRNEVVYSIFAKVFPYMMELKSAETIDKLPVTLRYVLNMRCTNPAKALFWIDNWLAKTQAAANENARNYVGFSTYEELTSETRAKTEREKRRLAGQQKDPEDLQKNGKRKKGVTGHGMKSFEEIMLELNNKIEKGTGLKNLYGVTIVTVEIQSVNLEGEHGRAVSEATTANYVAEQNARAKESSARGTAAALKLEADIMSANPFAARLRELQAIENAGANVTIVSKEIGVTPMLPIGNVEKNLNKKEG